MSTTSTSPKIMFVDDEPRVLQGMRRMLRAFRKEWQLSFAEGGAEALEMMRQSPVDIMISDMRMPNMDGAELLSEVMRHYPSTVRIILSGQSDQLAMLKCMEPAHQFLTKPCNSEELKRVIRQTCRFRGVLIGEDVRIREIVSRLTKVPCHPRRKQGLNAALLEKSPSIEHLVKIICSDVGMSLKMLQLVSSSFFGPPQKEILPERAVHLLGIPMIHALESQTDVFSPLECENCLADFEALTHYSFQVARMAQAVAKELSREASKADEINAYLAGLFHVVDAFFEFSDNREEEGPPAREESYDEILATSYRAKASAYMLGLWGIPTPIVEAIAHYRNPVEGENPDSVPLAALHIAHAVARKGEEANVLMEESYLKHNFGSIPRERWVDLCRKGMNEKETR